MPTDECDADIKFKETYINANENDVEIIQSPVGMPGRALKGEFLEKVKQGCRGRTRSPIRCAVLPEKAAYAATRRFNIGKGRFIYNLCQRHPNVAKRIIRSANVKFLPEDFDVATHFTPSATTRDQRLRGARR